MKGENVFKALVVAAATVMVVVMLPDIKRYIKISMM